MDAKRPRPDWVEDQKWHWPAWKFRMNLDELFTTLHDQFNTWPAPLQNFEAFHHDVWEISSTVATKQELFSALELRRKQRSEEMARVWDVIALHLTAGDSMLPNRHWQHGAEFFRTKSLDSMLVFLYSFLTDEEKEKVGTIDINNVKRQAALDGPQKDALLPLQTTPTHESVIRPARESLVPENVTPKTQRTKLRPRSQPISTGGTSRRWERLGSRRSLRSNAKGCRTEASTARNRYNLRPRS
ncbi:hypothetical protein F4802DRAFT_592373 [Xylaria palmicola]|nr:hypothetical protein F4802DRAFT_592373 [Xylaria palmicola]